MYGDPACLETRGQEHGDVFRIAGLQFTALDRMVFGALTKGKGAHLPKIDDIDGDVRIADSYYCLGPDFFGGNTKAYADYRVGSMGQHLLAPVLLYPRSVMKLRTERDELQRKHASNKVCFEAEWRRSLAIEIERLVGRTPCPRAVSLVKAAIATCGAIPIAEDPFPYEFAAARKLHTKRWNTNPLDPILGDLCLKAFIEKLADIVSAGEKQGACEGCSPSSMVGAWGLLLGSRVTQPSGISRLSQNVDSLLRAFMAARLVPDHQKGGIEAIECLRRFLERAGIIRGGGLGSAPITDGPRLVELRHLEVEPCGTRLLDMARRMDREAEDPAAVDCEANYFQFLAWLVMAPGANLGTVFAAIADLLPDKPENQRVKELRATFKLAPWAALQGRRSASPTAPAVLLRDDRSSEVERAYAAERRGVANAQSTLSSRVQGYKARR